MTTPSPRSYLPRRLRAFAAALALILAVSAAPASGQSNTRGPVIGLDLSGASWSLEATSAQGGGGLGLHVGYGLNNLVTLQTSLAAAYVAPEVGSDYALNHLDVGAQFHFRSAEKRWRPYAQAFLTGVRAEYGANEFGADAVITGSALTFGGGLKYFLRPTLALDLDLRLSGGEITKVRAGSTSGDPDMSMGSSRLGLGLAWYPLR